MCLTKNTNGNTINITKTVDQKVFIIYFFLYHCSTPLAKDFVDCSMNSLSDILNDAPTHKKNAIKKNINPIINHRIIYSPIAFRSANIKSDALSKSEQMYS